MSRIDAAASRLMAASIHTVIGESRIPREVAMEIAAALDRHELATISTFADLVRVGEIILAGALDCGLAPTATAITEMISRVDYFARSLGRRPEDIARGFSLMFDPDQVDRFDRQIAALNLRLDGTPQARCENDE